MLLTFSVKASVGAEGNPFVRYYHPLDYMGYSQNWYITQDSDGILYFANGDGILEFDGQDWKMHKVGNHNTPTCMLIEDGIIWVGAKAEIGFLSAKNGKGKKYTSLTNLLPEEAQDFGFVTRIARMGKYLYFGTSDKTFIWDNKQFSVLYHSPQSSLQKVKDMLFLYDHEKGLMLLTGKTQLAIEGGEFFKEKVIRDILPYDAERYLIITRYQGIFVVSFDFSVIYAPRLIIENKLISETYNKASADVIYQTIQLSGDRYAFATMLGGTYLMGSDGEYKGVLNRTSRIPNETHSCLFEDNEGNLWIALDNGIAKVMLSSNFTYLDERSGLFGSVLDIHFFKGSLYVGTWQGLFHMPINSLKEKEAVFNSIQSVKSQCWKLQMITTENDQQLWAATSDGLFVFSSGNNQRILSQGVYYAIVQSKKYPDLVFAGHREGIDVFILKNNSPQLFQSLRIPGQQSRVVSIQEDNNGTIWAGSEFQGVFSIHIHQQSGAYNLNIISHASKMPEAEYYYAYSRNNHIFFVSREGIFVPYFSEQSTEIEFKRILFHEKSSFQKDYYINIFHEDPISGECWLQLASKHRALKYFGRISGTNQQPQFIVNPYKLFPGYEIYAMQTDSSGLLWLGCDDGIFILNDKNIAGQKHGFDAIIRTVTLNKDSLYFDGSITAQKGKPELLPEFESKYNNLIFSFAANSYLDEEHTLFRYRLEGFEDDWSSWGKNSSKEYTNLQPGTYSFTVQSRDILDRISTVAKFDFIIHKPWYKTFLAWAIYLILFTGLIILGNIFTNRRLIKAKQKLENIVDKRTQELQMQKREIESEKEKTDRLLLNILPVKVAEELKSMGFSKAQYYDSATVLFTDFAGFTRIAEVETPQDLIDKLERFFILFDEIVIRNKLEKIKTIGDSHMSVGGLPVENRSHPFDCILAALEMIEVMDKARTQQEWASNWHLRIGIHTGNVIAGIVGKRKFAYDVWGDTVNTSSRLQETGNSDRINISKEMHAIIEPFFECEYRGKIQVKHKGEIDMYFVNRLKPEYSKNQEGTKPNLQFREMYWKL